MQDFSERFHHMNKVSPTLFVGLGGSGSEIVDRIAAKLRAQWNWKTFDGLVQFFALDTNIHDLAKLAGVPRENRLLMSDFDKESYVRKKRGREHMEEDPFLTQWVHDWYGFRGTRGVGAGQIRIESRLCLHYQLEQDRGGILKRLNSAINAAKTHDNPFRLDSPPRFNVFVYGSVAGGTGSGCMLPMAYVLRQLVHEQGWIPRIYGTVLMPGLFLNDVPGALQGDINANGYAALEEIDYLMKLGHDGFQETIRFHYNPASPQLSDVSQMPFDFVYIADKPAAQEVAEYKDAIADAAYLQIYSPIAGAQAADYDNYEKHQKRLAHGFTVHYGSYGCAVLILPDQDILRYCALRYTQKALSRYLLFEGFGEAAAEFQVPWDDPKFRRLDKAAQNALIDKKFCEFIEYLARRELQDGIEAGPYLAITEHKTRTGSSLLAEFAQQRKDLVKELDGLISLHTLAATDITELNIKVDAEVADLREEIGASRRRVSGRTEAVNKDVETGAWFSDFFSRHGTGPFGQRYFLAHLADTVRDDLRTLGEQLGGIEPQVDLDSEAVRTDIQRRRQTLTQTAELTLMERIKGRNADFEESKRNFLQFFNGTLVDGHRRALQLESELSFLREVLQHVETRLGAFRTVAVKARDAVAAVAREAQDFLLGGEHAEHESQSNLYTLDVEALRSTDGLRFWDRFFEDRFVAGGRDFDLFDEDEIFPLITDAMGPKRDDAGRRVPRTSDEIVDAMRAALFAEGERRLRPAIVGQREGGTSKHDKGLMLDEALRLEARYVRQAELAADGASYEPTPAQLRDYLKQKIAFCRRKSAIMATVVEDRLADGAAVVSKIDLVGMHDFYSGGALGEILSEVSPSTQRIPHWMEAKRVVFYQARLGMPLYVYERVNGDMKADYQRSAALQGVQRGYPLHIDKNFEEQLWTLDPMDQASERRADEVRQHWLRFVMGFVSGVLVEAPTGEVSWQVDGFSELLATSRAAALDAWEGLDDRTRERLLLVIEPAIDELREGHDGRRAALAAHIAELDARIWRLERDAKGVHGKDLQFLRQEENVAKETLNALP